VWLRLARHRKTAGLSAAALADRIPSPRITRAVISNIESGRKADPSFSEVALIASGLGMSPLEVFVDTTDPWASLDFDGLAGELDGMTTLEYLAATDVLSIDAISHVSPTARSFINALNRADEALHKRNVLEGMRRDGRPPGEGDIWLTAAPSGRTIAIDLAELSFNEPAIDDDQEVIDEYREALDYFQGRRNEYLNASRAPQRVLDRLERIRSAVVDLIAAEPTLDYGQLDRPNFGTPVLDPATGRPVPSERKKRRA